MSLLVQFLLQLLLPAVLLIDLFRKDYEQRRNWALDVILVASVLLIVFQSARWDEISYYLRILLLPAFGLIAYVAYRCIDRKKKPTDRAYYWKDYATYGIKGLIVLAALVLNGVMLQGTFSPEETVELAYPLHGGVYYVGGGGASRWINNHHAFPPQDYALDIVRLNVLGNRAMGLNPEDPERYAIFGDRLYCPCTGRVLSVEGGHPDNRPPATDEAFPAGNYVMIACKGVEVLMAHLKQGSILVEEGQQIEEGAAIAQIGNSGNSSQPHLHIHAERGGKKGEMLNGKGVPIRFNGRFLVRNSIFSGRPQP